MVTQRTEPCQCVSGQPWACLGALQGQMQSLLCPSGVVGPALGAVAGLCRWLVGGAVFPVCGNFQRRSHYSATTAHRALPGRGWPALGVPRGTERLNVPSAVSRRCCGACTGGCNRAVQVGLWGLRFCRFVEVSRGGGSTRIYHSAQSPASVLVASPGHAMGHCRIKYNLCGSQQE